MVSDLNKNIGGLTDLAKKKRRGSADLHTPIHSPQLGYLSSVDSSIHRRSIKQKADDIDITDLTQFHNAH